MMQQEVQQERMLISAAREVRHYHLSFDGSAGGYFLEGPDGWHAEWGTRMFDYGRLEVRRPLLGASVVRAPFARVGFLSVADHESYVAQTHAHYVGLDGSTGWDRYLDSHLGFVFDDDKQLDTVVAPLKSLQVPFRAHVSQADAAVLLFAQC